jgi:fatty acid desaturase
MDFESTATSAGDGTIIKYKADRWTVAIVLSVFALHCVVWWFASPLVAFLAMAPLTAVSCFVAAFGHHHYHVNVFRHSAVNRAYEIVLALQTGASPYTWVLHHNLGHHAHYLNQRPHAEPDESCWTRADGTQMGRFEYALHTFWHRPMVIYRVGKRYPSQYRAYLWMKVPYYGAMALGLYLSPLNFILVFTIPAVLTLFHTCWATYEHHAGHYASEDIEASVNREHPLFNLLTGNLGLHTAHHSRPGLHWSLLPELHGQLRPRIPEKQLLQTFW